MAKLGRSVGTKAARTGVRWTARSFKRKAQRKPFRSITLLSVGGVIGAGVGWAAASARQPPPGGPGEQRPRRTSGARERRERERDGELNPPPRPRRPELADDEPRALDGGEHLARRERRVERAARRDPGARLDSFSSPITLA